MKDSQKISWSWIKCLGQGRDSQNILMGGWRYSEYILSKLVFPVYVEKRWTTEIFAIKIFEYTETRFVTNTWL